MKTLPYALLIICLLYLDAPSFTQAKSTAIASTTISLDCTIKGGTADGTHLLITILPKMQQVTISGLQSIVAPTIAIAPDITINNNETLAANRIIGKQRAERYQDEPGHDPIFDYRNALKRGYVQVSYPFIVFGYTTWLPATPYPRQQSILAGPESNFTIDRRTGALRFQYAGTGFVGNCTARKKRENF